MLNNNNKKNLNSDEEALPEIVLLWKWLGFEFLKK